MADILDSLPYPLTQEQLNHLGATGKFRRVHPEVIAGRSVDGEGTKQVVPAFLLVTETVSIAVVETEERDGYRVLERSDADDEAAYDALNEWCAEHGYV